MSLGVRPKGGSLNGVSPCPRVSPNGGSPNGRSPRVSPSPNGLSPRTRKVINPVGVNHGTSLKQREIELGKPVQKNCTFLTGRLPLVGLLSGPRLLISNQKMSCTIKVTTEKFTSQ